MSNIPPNNPPPHDTGGTLHYGGTSEAKSPPLDPFAIIVAGTLCRVGVNTLGCGHKVFNTEIRVKAATTAALLFRRVEILITDVCANRYECKVCQSALRSKLTEEEKTYIGYSEPTVGGPANVGLHGAIQDVKDIAEQVSITDEDHETAERLAKRHDAP